jgi:archaellum component FlaC
MSLKKPSQLFQEEKVFVREDYNPIVETFNEVFDKFKGNVSLIEDIKQKVDILAEEIGDKITKSDLETAMYSHLIMVDENIKDIQSKVKGLNKNDLLEFKSTSSHLTKIVDDLRKMINN